MAFEKTAFLSQVEKELERWEVPSASICVVRHGGQAGL